MTKRHWPTTPQLLTAYDFVTLSWERAKKPLAPTDPGGYNPRTDPLVWGSINVNPRTGEITGRI